MSIALDDLRGAVVVVLGAGVSGTSAAAGLEELGAKVRVVDDRDGPLHQLPSGAALVVASPGFRPSHPLLRAAEEARVPVWGEVELAWRLSRAQPHPAPWLAVTGTNGKTTTTELLTAILRADGRAAIACGNIGLPVVDAVRAGREHEILAVELSSFQLHAAPSLRPLAGVVLNLAQDHLDWHGDLAAYGRAKLRAYGDAGTVAVGVREAEGSLELLARAPGRRITVTLGAPGPDELGIVREVGGPALLVDRAFASGAPTTAEALGTLEELPNLSAAHEVTNALAAAALARAAGVSAAAVASGLAAHVPGAHRRSLVATVQDVVYVDDSKATNPHAALASLTAYDSVVWIAGGLNKGLTFDDLVRAARGSLRAAVLLGRCADEIAEAMTRHAPDIALVRVDTLEDGVHEAARLARPGDTVLLAPAAASQDMFRDYAQRGDVFAAAVRDLPSAPA